MVILFWLSRSLVRIAGSKSCSRWPVTRRGWNQHLQVRGRKWVACPFQVGGEFLPQVEEFKYLGVLFTSEGRMEREIDGRIGAAAAEMRSMYRSVVVKKELSLKAKLSICRSIYVPTLTYGHELWVMTKRTRSWIQAAEMSFLRRVAGRTLRDRVRSSVTREELGVEPLLLHIERNQLRWLGHLFQMSPGRLPGEVLRAFPTGRRPREDPGHAGGTMSLSLPGNALGFPRRSWRKREVWSSLLRLLPPATRLRISGWWWMDGWLFWLWGRGNTERDRCSLKNFGFLPYCSQCQFLRNATQAKLICSLTKMYSPLWTIIEDSISLQSSFSILQMNLHHFQQYPAAVCGSIQVSSANSGCIFPLYLPWHWLHAGSGGVYFDKCCMVSWECSQ